jgi:hypothetical protein
VVQYASRMATDLISTTLALMSITRCLLLLPTRFLIPCFLRVEYVVLPFYRQLEATNEVSILTGRLRRGVLVVLVLDLPYPKLHPSTSEQRNPYWLAFTRWAVERPIRGPVSRMQLVRAVVA